MLRFVEDDEQSFFLAMCAVHIWPVALAHNGYICFSILLVAWGISKWFADGSLGLTHLQPWQCGKAAEMYISLLRGGKRFP